MLKEPIKIAVTSLQAMKNQERVNNHSSVMLLASWPEEMKVKDQRRYETYCSLWDLKHALFDFSGTYSSYGTQNMLC